jgi:hypothetical protein
MCGRHASDPRIGAPSRNGWNLGVNYNILRGEDFTHALSRSKANVDTVSLRSTVGIRASNAMKSRRGKPDGQE